MRRPPSVNAAATILYVLSGLALLGCCGFNVLIVAGNPPPAELNRLRWILTGILLASAAINGVLAYFIVRARQWARATAIVLNALGILASVTQLLRGSLSSCLGVIIEVTVIVLLSTETAGQYFRR
jgi:hypothetical protein